MNELIFLGHIVIVMGLVLGALALGRSALIAIVALQGVLANLFVLKQISLFGFTVTCSDVYIIGSVLALNLVQEFFGKKEAQKAIWVAFLALISFTILGQVQLFYQPSPFDTKHTSYASLFAPQIRITAASLIAYFTSQQIDVRLFARIPKSLPLPVRSFCSASISQMADTLLFSFIGLYGMVASIVDILIVSFCIKLFVIFCMSSMVSLSKRVVKTT